MGIDFIFVCAIAAAVMAGGYMALDMGLAMGPVILALAALPVCGLLLSRRNITGAAPDMVFGSVDTGLLVIPAIFGGAMFGAPGAIAGAVIGDSVTDALAGFFEGGVAQWLRDRGIVESREAVATSLGKMAGCLAGSGLTLTLADLLGLGIGIV